jgi:hypothetical protein
MDGCIPLVVLMIDEELPLNLSQKRILTQFVKYRHQKISPVVLNSKNQTCVTF